MKKMKKVAVVGVYGTGTDFTTGQAVKCRTLIDWMKRKFGSDEVVIVNTYKWMKNPLKLLVSMIFAMKSCNNIVIMPAQNGIKVFAPLVYHLNKIYHRNIQYIVIGGWLAEMLKEKDILKRQIASFRGIHVETKSMKVKLEDLGMTNVYYMPNSRPYTELNKKDFPHDKKVVKVCTYSRVVKSKGIDDAIKICRKANSILGSKIFYLDIYGKIDEDYKKEFKNLVKSNSEIASYQGCRNSDETLSVLNDYFALLFPTYYAGEGFAGTILDAFAAELPIIANDWKYNSEVITDGENGLLYPFRNIEIAAKKLVSLYRDTKLYDKIRKGCKESAYRYSTEYVMVQFERLLH